MRVRFLLRGGFWSGPAFPATHQCRPLAPSWLQTFLGPGARQADLGASRKKHVQAQDLSVCHRPQAQTSGTRAVCAGLGAKEDSGTLPSLGVTLDPELRTQQQAIGLKGSEPQSPGASARRAPGTAEGGAGSRRSPGRRELDLMLWETSDL